MFDDVYMNDVAKVWRRKGLDENVKRRWMAKSEKWNVWVYVFVSEKFLNCVFLLGFCVFKSCRNHATIDSKD